MKPKGRPPVIERIAALEARIAEIEAKLSSPVLQVEAHGRAGNADTCEYYKPLFDRWPGNGSAK